MDLLLRSVANIYIHRTPPPEFSQHCKQHKFSFIIFGQNSSLIHSDMVYVLQGFTGSDILRYEVY